MKLRLASVALAGGLCLRAIASGPADTLYITVDSGSQLVQVLQSTQSFSPTVFGNEGPIAVDGSIATTGVQPGGLGGSYNLSGAFTGGVYANQLTNSASDGTTDGNLNYVIDSLGDVYSTDRTFQLPTYLFSAGSSATGISYDPANTSLWIDQNGLVEDFSPTGTLVGDFATGLTGYSALAFDRNDGTLWMGTNLSGGGAILTQYSAGGAFLQIDAALTVNDIEGMEFNEAKIAITPEPSPLLVLGLGAGILPLIGRRRRIANSKRPAKGSPRENC